MGVVKIVATVFDALLMFFIGYAAFGMEDRKSVGISTMVVVILIINLFCMWG